MNTLSKPNTIKNKITSSDFDPNTFMHRDLKNIEDKKIHILDCISCYNTNLDITNTTITGINLLTNQQTKEYPYPNYTIKENEGHCSIKNCYIISKECTIIDFDLIFDDNNICFKLDNKKYTKQELSKILKKITLLKTSKNKTINKLWTQLESILLMSGDENE